MDIAIAVILFLIAATVDTPNTGTYFVVLASVTVTSIFMRLKMRKAEAAAKKEHEQLLDQLASIRGELASLRMLGVAPAAQPAATAAAQPTPASAPRPTAPPPSEPTPIRISAPPAPAAPAEPVRPSTPMMPPGEPARPVASASTSAASPTIPYRPLTPATPSTPSAAAPPPLRPTSPAPTPITNVPPIASYSQPKQTTRQKARSFADFAEDTFGSNWAGKIGVGLVVLGIVGFIASQWGRIPAVGKVALLLLAGGSMLAGGIFAERKEQLRIFGRSLIAGGWALLFYTSFAMHFVEVTRIIGSESVDLVLMLATAGVMVSHTLKYKSQAVTGLAYILAFTTVTISQTTWFSLSAGLILAGALVILCNREQWFELEVFGILASYGNHWKFLRPIIEPMGAQHVAFPEFWMSTGVLLIYWAVFRASYIARKVASHEQESVSSVAAILNPLLLLLVMKYQSVRPELAFYALLALGALEFTLALLPITRRRRTAFVMLSIIGVALMTAAVPFKYSGSNVAILWLIGGQALLAAGIAQRERAFTRLGGLVSLLTAAHLLIIDAGPKLQRAAEGEAFSKSNGLGIAVLVSAVVLFIAGNLLPRRWEAAFEHEADNLLTRVLSYACSLLAGVGLWLVLPYAWTIVGWAALMVALAAAARFVDSDDLLLQSSVLGIATLIRLVVINLQLPSEGHFSARLLTLASVAVLFYLAAITLHRIEGDSPNVLRVAHEWVGSALIGLLLWYELPAAWMGVGYVAFALVLCLFWRWQQLDEFWWQANLAALVGFGRVLAHDLFDASIKIGPLHTRVLTGVIAAAGFYILANLSRRTREQWRDYAELHSWAGSVLITTLLWTELQPLNVAIAWAVFGLVFFELGLVRNLPSLRWQGAIALTASFARIFFVNLNAVPEPGALSPRIYSIVPLALIYLYMYWRSETHGEELLAPNMRKLIPALFSYFGVVAIVALVRFEVPAQWVITAWAAIALVLVAVSYAAKRGVFLQQAILLAFTILFRGLLSDFFGGSYFTTSGRLLSAGGAIALLFAALPTAFWLRDRTREHEPSGMQGIAAILGHPEQIFFFVPLTLLTVLLALETRKGAITMAWGLEGFAVLLFALAIGERSFRLSGLGLLALCVLKLFAVDFLEFSTRDRYLTFIALGAALVATSFLYGRFKHRIRELL